MTSWTRAAACWRTRWGPDGTTAVWPPWCWSCTTRSRATRTRPGGWRRTWTVWSGWEGGFDDTPYAAELLASIRRKGAHWGALLRSASARTEGDEALYRGYGEEFLQVSVAFDALAQVQTWEAARQTEAAVAFPRLSTPRGRKDEPGIAALKQVWERVQGGGEEAGGPVVCL
ncbi:hypothetical protein [Oscillibacter sp.]|uniref:hypothetical protein n=1 Tax=Oscillibacter sp. TaxID=1945593 RepID=UPI002579CC68|nr:hypothetical protein [Oscillibacter sp.]